MRTRTVIAGAVLVSAVLILAVAASVGGRSKQSKSIETKGATTVALSASVGRGGYSVVESLTLSWGSGSRSIPTVPSDYRTMLYSVFLGSEDRIFVVDHVPGTIGSRVRWFADGRLAGDHAAPAGSTLFTADGDGFMYVIAKGAQRSETVVLVDAGGSVTATFTVPLQINSGGLVRAGDTLYVRAAYSSIDPDGKVYEAKDALVPVVSAGKQVDDDTAEKNVVDAWTVLAGGTKVVSRYSGTAVEGSKEIPVDRYVSFDGAREIKAPADSILLSASEAERAIWFLYPPRPITARGTPGWPAVYDVQGLLVKVGESGKVLSMIPVQMSRLANPADYGWRDRVSSNGESVIVATADTKHVKILVFGRR